MSPCSLVTVRPSARRDSYDALGSAAPFTAYEAPGWLPGGQLQTIYGYYLRQTPGFTYRRERWETPDRDFIDVDWLDTFTQGSRLLVLFHGLEGCSCSHYAVSLMNQLRGEGWCGVVPHFRGCGGEINRFSRLYHAADSAEINWILHQLKANQLASHLYAVGVSLGGNMLLKWLGEQGERALDVVERAVAVSVPVDLQMAAKQLDDGKPWLRHIKVPTLLINARNDPFFPGDSLPTQGEVSQAVTLEYPSSGGHVGFVSGRFPGQLNWLPRRVLRFLADGGKKVQVASSSLARTIQRSRGKPSGAKAVGLCLERPTN